MRKRVNWVTQLWGGRVDPTHRMIAVVATFLIFFIVMGVLIAHSVLARISPPLM